MIKKITYEAKVALQNDEDVPDNEKLRDIDVNEIKDVVNSNADELNRTNSILNVSIESPIIYRNRVETKEELEALQNVKPGNIYTVNNEQQNYIYTEDNEWVEYNVTIDISSFNEEQEEQNTNIAKNTSEINALKEEDELQNSRLQNLEGKSAILAISNQRLNVNQSKELIVSFTEENVKKGEDLELVDNTKIKCKKAGFIAISYKICLYNGFVGGSNILCKIYKNGSEIARLNYRPSDNHMQSILSELRIMEVAENDEIDLRFVNYDQNCVIGNTAKSQGNSINIFYL